MSKIKGVILSVEDTILPKGKIDGDIFSEVDKLIKYFKIKILSLSYLQIALGLLVMTVFP